MIILDITGGIVASIKKVIRRYYETLHASKNDSLCEITPNLHRKEIESLNDLILLKKQPAFIKRPHPQRKLHIEIASPVNSFRI